MSTIISRFPARNTIPLTQAPGKDSEVFIGNLPMDMYEDVLIPVLEAFGVLREVRLMNSCNSHSLHLAPGFLAPCTGLSLGYEFRKKSDFGPMHLNSTILVGFFPTWSILRLWPSSQSWN